jgi:hypothetical protein
MPETGRRVSILPTVQVVAGGAHGQALLRPHSA